MDELALRRSLAKKSDSKIVLYVIDGVGGLPGAAGLTELQAAKTPNMDALAARSTCGLHDPVAPGITPGSGPGHLALFGYEPTEHMIGRGALAAAGIGFPMQAGDVAMRINYCSLDDAGNVTDRRAGRIPTEKNEELTPLLREIKIDGVELFVETVREYRSAVVFRPDGGPELSGNLTDSDSQQTGVPPLAVEALDDESAHAANVANEFIAKAVEALSGQTPANGILLRGASGYPTLPTFQDLYGLKPAAVASYPMYRGVARFAGMEALGIDEIKTFDDELAVLGKRWSDYDYFFVHYKYTDSRGEDGDFDAKVAEIEKADEGLAAILKLEPDVICVTGDHSTPSVCKAHSWHPVPVMLSGDLVRPDGVTEFTELACAGGALGRCRGKDLMPQMLATAGRLEKFGA